MALIYILVIEYEENSRFSVQENIYNISQSSTLMILLSISFWELDLVFIFFQLSPSKTFPNFRFFKMLVEVTEGKLKGEKLKNILTSEEYYSFKGIPFAKPPVGPLRFKVRYHITLKITISWRIFDNRILRMNQKSTLHRYSNIVAPLY